MYKKQKCNFINEMEGDLKMKTISKRLPPKKGWPPQKDILENEDDPKDTETNTRNEDDPIYKTALSF